MSLKDEIIAYKNNTDLKNRYVKFVTDESIPLAERWEVFKEAPGSFKNHQNYIVHFDSEKLMPGGEVSWYDDFYLEKYETMDMFSFVEDRLVDEDVEAGIVDAWRQEILRMNLGSFKFDW